MAERKESSLQSMRNRNEMILQQRISDAQINETNQRNRAERNENRAFRSILSSHQEKIRILKSFAVCSGCQQWVGQLIGNASASELLRATSSCLGTADFVLDSSSSLGMGSKRTLIDSDEFFLCIDCIDLPQLCPNCVTAVHFNPIEIVDRLEDIDSTLRLQQLERIDEDDRPHRVLSLPAAKCASAKTYLNDMRQKIRLKLADEDELRGRGNQSFLDVAPSLASSQRSNGASPSTTPTPQSLLRPGTDTNHHTADSSAVVSTFPTMDWEINVKLAIEKEEKRCRHNVEKDEFRHNYVKTRVPKDDDYDLASKTADQGQDPALGGSVGGGGESSSSSLRGSAALSSGVLNSLSQWKSGATLSKDMSVSLNPGTRAALLAQRKVLGGLGAAMMSSLEEKNMMTVFVNRFAKDSLETEESVMRQRIADAADLEENHLSKERDGLRNIIACETREETLELVALRAYGRDLVDEHEQLLEENFDKHVQLLEGTWAQQKNNWENEPYSPLVADEYSTRHKIFLSSCAQIRLKLLPFYTVHHSTQRSLTIMDFIDQFRKLRESEWRNFTFNRLPIFGAKFLHLQFINNRKLMYRLESLVLQGVEAKHRAHNVFLTEHRVRQDLLDLARLSFCETRELDTRHSLEKRRLFYVLGQVEAQEEIRRERLIESRTEERKTMLLRLRKSTKPDPETMKANLLPSFKRVHDELMHDLVCEDEIFLFRFYPELLPEGYEPPSLAQEDDAVESDNDVGTSEEDGAACSQPQEEQLPLEQVTPVLAPEDATTPRELNETAAGPSFDLPPELNFYTATPEKQIADEQPGEEVVEESKKLSDEDSDPRPLTLRRRSSVKLLGEERSFATGGSSLTPTSNSFSKHPDVAEQKLAESSKWRESLDPSDWIKMSLQWNNEGYIKGNQVFASAASIIAASPILNPSPPANDEGSNAGSPTMGNSTNFSPGTTPRHLNSNVFNTGSAAAAAAEKANSDTASQQSLSRRGTLVGFEASAPSFYGIAAAKSMRRRKSKKIMKSTFEAAPAPFSYLSLLTSLLEAPAAGHPSTLSLIEDMAVYSAQCREGQALIKQYDEDVAMRLQKEREKELEAVAKLEKEQSKSTVSVEQRRKLKMVMRKLNTSILAVKAFQGAGSPSSSSAAASPSNNRSSLEGSRRSLPEDNGEGSHEASPGTENELSVRSDAATSSLQEEEDQEPPQQPRVSMLEDLVNNYHEKLAMRCQAKYLNLLDQEEIDRLQSLATRRSRAAVSGSVVERLHQATASSGNRSVASSGEKRSSSSVTEPVVVAEGTNPNNTSVGAESLLAEIDNANDKNDKGKLKSSAARNKKKSSSLLPPKPIDLRRAKGPAGETILQEDQLLSPGRRGAGSPVGAIQNDNRSFFSAYPRGDGSRASPTVSPQRRGPSSSRDESPLDESKIAPVSHRRPTSAKTVRKYLEGYENAVELSVEASGKIGTSPAQSTLSPRRAQMTNTQKDEPFLSKEAVHELQSAVSERVLVGRPTLNRGKKAWSSKAGGFE